MLTETYGGTCPMCKYNRMMMRFGSSGYMHYDACPKCGFALMEWEEPTYKDKKQDGWEWKTLHDKKAWKKIIDAEHKTKKEWLSHLDALPEPHEDRTSVFRYHKKNGKIEACTCPYEILTRVGERGYFMCPYDIARLESEKDGKKKD